MELKEGKKKLSLMIALAIIFFSISSAVAAPDQPCLNPNQTASEAADNMTSVLRNMSNVSSAEVQIKADLCLFEISASSKSEIDWGEVKEIVADLYATYMEQHQDYSGSLILNMNTISDGPTRTETITIKPTRLPKKGYSLAH